MTNLVTGEAHADGCFESEGDLFLPLLLSIFLPSSSWSLVGFHVSFCLPGLLFEFSCHKIVKFSKILRKHRDAERETEREGERKGKRKNKRTEDGKIRGKLFASTWS